MSSRAPKHIGISLIFFQFSEINLHHTKVIIIVIVIIIIIILVLDVTFFFSNLKRKEYAFSVPRHYTEVDLLGRWVAWRQTDNDIMTVIPLAISHFSRGRLSKKTIPSV